MALKETGREGVKWISLVEDTSMWRAVVSMVINFGDFIMFHISTLKNIVTLM